MTQSVGAILEGDFVPEERILLEASVIRQEQTAASGAGFE